MKTFYIKTLGCKVNQYESQGIATELERCGFKKSDDGKNADIIIVNTCSVTSKADMQSRQEIRKASKRTAGKKLVVTGCYAQTASETIKEIVNADMIVDQRDKFKIAEALCFNHPLSPPKSNICEDTKFRSFKHTVKTDMTRAYLKIHDGCNAFCSYCIVPYSRGRSRSMPMDEVIKHLENLNASGYMEVVLTGIHTGSWGLDFPTRSNLFHLLETVVQKRPVHRVRISSIEPNELTDDIIELAAAYSVVCPHFHIPLQSGDDNILKKMDRPYNTAKFQDLIEKIKKRMPYAKIGTDVMAGFPGEDQESFEKTLSFLRKVDVNYLHVFPFSPRRGTRAYTFENRVASVTIRHRCKLLRHLSEEKREKFEKSCIGKPFEGVVLSSKETHTNFSKTVTSNYLFTVLSHDNAFKEKIVTVVPEKWDIDNRRLYGTIK